jgi:hypothetical protein
MWAEVSVKAWWGLKWFPETLCKEEHQAEMAIFAMVISLCHYNLACRAEKVRI